MFEDWVRSVRERPIQAASATLSSLPLCLSFSHLYVLHFCTFNCNSSSSRSSSLILSPSPSPFSADLLDLAFLLELPVTSLVPWHCRPFILRAFTSLLVPGSFRTSSLVHTPLPLPLRPPVLFLGFFLPHPSLLLFCLPSLCLDLDGSFPRAILSPPLSLPPLSPIPPSRPVLPSFSDRYSHSTHHDHAREPRPRGISLSNPEPKLLRACKRIYSISRSQPEYKVNP